MNYIKAKYMKSNVMQGRAYTFKTEEDVSHGDILETSDGKKVMVVDEPVDMDWVEPYGADKVAVVKKVEPMQVLKQNPCRYCANHFEYKGRNKAGWECRKDCEFYSQHQEYLKSKRMYEIGERITSMSELMEQTYVFWGQSETPKHIEVIRSWQYRMVENALNGGRFYKAIKKVAEPTKAESENK